MGKQRKIRKKTSWFSSPHKLKSGLWGFREETPGGVIINHHGYKTKKEAGEVRKDMGGG